jgi:hypothetical protein
MSLWSVWRSVDLPGTNTQYLRFEFNNNLVVGELAIYAGGSGATATAGPATSTPTRTATPTRTSTAGPTATRTSTPNATATRTSTPTATRTSTPTATPTRTSTPTATSAPGGCTGLVKVGGLSGSSTAGSGGDPTGNAPVSYLTDEQSGIGDPPSGTPANLYRPGWGTSAGTPTRLDVNLGSSRCVKRISWWDGLDSGTVSVYTGAPGSWTLLTTLTNDLYQQWAQQNVTATSTQYLRFEFTSYPQIGEIAVYAGQ